MKRPISSLQIAAAVLIGCLVVSGIADPIEPNPAPDTRDAAIAHQIEVIRDQRAEINRLQRMVEALYGR